MKAREIESARTSPKVTLRPGDKIRAKGGPTYKGKRIGNPGVYVVDRLFRKGNRVFAQARIFDKRHGVPAATFTLFISGKPYRSRLVESIVERPYRVGKVRS